MEPIKGEVQLWDVATRKPIGPPLSLDAYPSADSTFSPDGKKFLIGYQNGGGQLWDVVARKRIAILSTGHHWPDVAFSPDSRVAVTLGNRQIELWDAETGKSLGKPLVHEGVENIALTLTGTFSPDSKKIVTGSPNGTARLWEVATGKPIGQPLKHGREVNALAFSPDGKLVLTGSLHGRDARLWDVASGKPVGAPLPHPGPVYRAGFSSDSKTIETVSYDGLRLWNLNLIRPLYEMPESEKDPWVIAFGPDGKPFLTGSRGEAWGPTTLRIRDASNGKVVGKPIKMMWTAAYSPDGKIIVTGGDKGLLHKWDSATGTRLGEPLQHQHPGSINQPIQFATFSPDGKTILAAAKASGAIILPDDGKIAVQLWDAATGAPLGKPLRSEIACDYVVFSPNSKFFATVSNPRLGDNKRETQLWDAVARTRLGEPFAASAMNEVVFTPDSKKLLVGVHDAGPGDKTKGFWLDSATGKPAGSPLDFKEYLWLQAFHPNGELITTLPDVGARLWDVKKLAPVGEILRHASVRMVRLSPDGKTLLTVSGASLGLWDLHTGKSIGPLVPHGELDWQFAPGAIFSPDSKTVVTRGDRRARMWRVPTPIQGDAKDFRLWLEVNTGQELDAGGTVVDLDAKTWRERYDRLRKLGGPPAP
ncbi:MAG: WD40 repeat domain-containing protein [Planctomycetes bacterium]|nr:WD40 repeat domain-containing protein [Planctomycetota bacterium]